MSQPPMSKIMCSPPRKIAGDDLCDILLTGNMLLVGNELPELDAGFRIAADRRVAIVSFGFDNIERALTYAVANF